MSKLLINEHPLQVLPSLACAIGLNEAIVLQQVHYWTLKLQPAADGNVWVYNTVEQWRQQFPFWSEDTIARALKSLRARGVLIAEQRAKNAFNKTLYYRIDRQALEALDTGNLRHSVPQAADCAPQGAGADAGNLRVSGDAACQSLYTETSSETTHKRKTPHTPQGGQPGSADAPKKTRKSSGAIAIVEWLTAMKEAGERPIPEGDPLFAWAKTIGLPEDFLLIAWKEFKHQQTEKGGKQKDWRAHFRNAVRGNWLKLWWVDGDTYKLTTAGAQAQKYWEAA